MAAVAITFARYFLELIVRWPIADGAVAAGTLALLTVVNCLGVRAGSNVQNALMLLKIAAIAAARRRPAWLATARPAAAAQAPAPLHGGSLAAIGAAMTPVMFAYGGWQTASFVVRRDARPAPRSRLRPARSASSASIALYLAVNCVCLRALGPDGLAEHDHARDGGHARSRSARRGATLIALGIAISTLGFLSQGMLTAPRVYYAMAEDGVFFAPVAQVHPTHARPVVAILLAGRRRHRRSRCPARYEQILSYVVSVDFICFGLTGPALFVFRRRDARLPPASAPPATPSPPPSSPLTCWIVVIGTFVRFPINSTIGLGILLAGLPAYAFWRARSA